MKTETATIAKVCHDLITPLNAINLGMEAYEISRDESLLANLKESVEKANATIKFMRELFSEKSRTFCYSSRSLTQLISEYLKFYNITIELKSDMESIAGIAGEIIMYMAMVAKEIMPYGGAIKIVIDDEKSEIVTKCRGESASIPQMDITEEVNHRNIIRYNFMKLLQEAGFELIVYSEGQDIVFCKRMKY